jgi:hypothetical protein
VRANQVDPQHYGSGPNAILHRYGLIRGIATDLLALDIFLKDTGRVANLDTTVGARVEASRNSNCR